MSVELGSRAGNRRFHLDIKIVTGSIAMTEIHLFWRIYLAMSVNMDENDKSRIASSFARLHVRMQRYRPSDSAITTPRRLPQRHLAQPRLSFSGNGYWWSSNVTRRRDSTTPGLSSSVAAAACVYNCTCLSLREWKCSSMFLSHGQVQVGREIHIWGGGKEEVFLKVKRRGGGSLFALATIKTIGMTAK